MLVAKEGLRDAETIISNLARDKNGNIIESIKIVAHSMGGAYAKGYIAALIKYVNEHPEQCNGLKITEYDFAIYQPGQQKVIPGVTTRQFVNKGDRVNKWYLGSSNEEEEGADSYKEGKGGHSIFDFKWFFDDKGNLVEGTYVWDSQQKKFVKQ